MISRPTLGCSHWWKFVYTQNAAMISFYNITRQHLGYVQDVILFYFILCTMSIYKENQKSYKKGFVKDIWTETVHGTSKMKYLSWHIFTLFDGRTLVFYHLLPFPTDAKSWWRLVRHWQLKKEVLWYKIFSGKLSVSYNIEKDSLQAIAQRSRSTGLCWKLLGLR